MGLSDMIDIWSGDSRANGDPRTRILVTAPEVNRDGSPSLTNQFTCVASELVKHVPDGFQLKHWPYTTGSTILECLKNEYNRSLARFGYRVDATEKPNGDVVLTLAPDAV